MRSRGTSTKKLGFIMVTFLAASGLCGARMLTRMASAAPPCAEYPPCPRQMPSCNFSTFETFLLWPGVSRTSEFRVKTEALCDRYCFLNRDSFLNSNFYFLMTYDPSMIDSNLLGKHNQQLLSRTMYPERGVFGLQEASHHESSP